MQTRRKFLSLSSKILTGLGAVPLIQSCGNPETLPENLAREIASMTDEGLFFKISLAQWSLNRELFSGRLDHLDFAAAAKNKLGISAIEYVSTFFSDKIDDRVYLKQMKQRAEDAGVEQLLIMVDSAGSLATLNEKARMDSVERHFKYLDVAKFLGCKTIRVNASGKGRSDEISKLVVNSLTRLSDHATPLGLNVVVENHGGYSSNGQWLANVMRKVNRPNVGTLPDLGNFTVNWFPFEQYDPYKGTEELMPFAKGVSAKTHSFDKEGKESHIDYQRMLKIIKNSGFRGHIGIEYEGFDMDPYHGVLATKNLLIKTAQDL